MQNKESIEAVSNLIRACGLIGATYAKNRITLSDGTGLTLEDKEDFWFVHNCCLVQKSSTPKATMLALLELHLKIVKEKP